jgi:hypothetical protein
MASAPICSRATLKNDVLIRRALTSVVVGLVFAEF